ncbi:YrdB family protein [Microbacterium sp. NPDC056052]|uniref:YrdB family protein n=1 Tax=Microbacterium sp. NPDC056052 TaxID=3345695 RepID=UPI0035D9DD20
MSDGPARDPFLEGGPALRFALALRFLVELALLAGAATAAVRLVPGWPGWVSAIVAVALLAAVWGLLLSPKARFDIRAPGRLSLEAVLFGTVGAALWTSGLGIVGLALFAVWVLDRIALAVLGRR